MRAHDRIAVAELGTQVHFRGNPGQCFDHELPHQRGVEGGPAGHDADPADVPQGFGAQPRMLQKDPPLIQGDPPPDGVPDGPRLFEDLLEHEMFEPALLRRDRVPQDLFAGPLLLFTGKGADSETPFLYDDHLAVFQEHHFPGVGEDGRDIRGDEIFLFSHPYDERALFAGGDQLVFFSLVQHRDGIRAPHLEEGLADRRLEIGAPEDLALNQVAQDLRIGLGLEGVALGGEERF